MRAFLAGVALLAALPAAGQPVIDLTGVAAPARPGKPFAARNLPDRIILTPGADPSTAMAVSWRTDTAQANAEAEIVPMLASPGFGALARAVAGKSWPTTSENGPATYHQARFDGLTPDTPYAYRVKGSAGWSEWQQFRTASADAKPFSFIYLGDTQNHILDIGSLAWRRALLQAGNPELMLHAGDLVASRDEMLHDDEWGQWFQAGGWALAMHAIGDAALDFALDVIAEARGRFGRPVMPHRVEHGGVVRDDQVARMAELEVVMATQPNFISAFGGSVRERIGPERAALSYPAGRLLRAGLVLPGSSDRPVAGGRPLEVIQDFVLRRTETGEQYGPDAERLTVAEALHAYTVGSAEATGWGGRKGRLVAGQLADFTVLSEDPRAVPSDQIAAIDVVATAVGGEFVHGGL